MTQKPQVVGQDYADRLMTYLDYRLAPGARMLEPIEVAVVLRGLADHTALMAALQWRRDEDSPWPEATSFGRWFHDTADQLDRLQDASAVPARETVGPPRGRANARLIRQLIDDLEAQGPGAILQVAEGEDRVEDLAIAEAALPHFVDWLKNRADALDPRRSEREQRASSQEPVAPEPVLERARARRERE